MIFRCVLTLVLATSSVVDSRPVDIKAPVKKYLQDFGYMAWGEENEAEEKKAAKDFQKFSSLPQSGEIDFPTMLKMVMPRCGNPDKDANVWEEDRRKRKERFLLFPDKWTTNDLTYLIETHTKDLGKKQQKAILKRAMKLWTDVTPLAFTEAATADQAHIIFKFGESDHGDSHPFDGKGGVLAHAFYPTLGDVHFDDAEKFSDGTSKHINLLLIATHELGHSLGLQHSTEPKAVMYPFYQGYRENFALHQDDIDGIQALYGPSIVVSNPPVAQTPPPELCQDSNKKLCKKYKKKKTCCKHRDMCCKTCQDVECEDEKG